MISPITGFLVGLVVQMILPYLSIIYNFYNKTKVKNGENKTFNLQPPATALTIMAGLQIPTVQSPPNHIPSRMPPLPMVALAAPLRSLTVSGNHRLSHTSTIRVDIPNRKRTRRRNFSDKFEHDVRGTLEWTQSSTCQCQTRLESLAYHINFVIPNSTGENNMIWYTPHQS